MQTEQTEPDIEAVKVQYELERLKRIDEQNRLRTIKYLKKRQQEGKRQISAIIPESTYQEICRLRDKSILEGELLTAGDIIEIAVSNLSNKDKGNEIINTFAVNINTDKTMDKSIDNPDIEAMLNHAKGVWTGKESKEYTAYLREMIFKLHTEYSLSSNKIKALLEAHGVKTAKGYDIWSKGTIININIQQKRLNGGVIDAGE